MQHSPTPTISLNEALTLGEKLCSLISKCETKEELESINSNEILDQLLDIQNILEDSNLDSESGPLIKKSIRELEEEYDNEDTISDADAGALKSKAIACSHLIDKELKEVQTVPVDSSGILDTNKLLESPDDLFTSSVWEWLDEMPRNDLEEACRSIAVGNSTSAVILSLRAVEYCLLEWHETETGDEIDAPWGMLLNILVDYHLSDDKKDGTLPEKLSHLPPVLSNLFYLKERRNSVNHPKEIPSPRVARQTLVIAVGTIEDIYSELELDGAEPERLDAIFSSEDDEIVLNADQQLVYQYLEKIDDGDGVPRNELYDILQKDEEMDPQKVDDLIMDLLMSGNAYEPSANRIKPI
jgi:hypothetical protein